MTLTQQSPAADTAEAPGARQRQYVTFLVDESTYGVDINLVREIKQWTPTTLLPNQPAFTRGVLNLRGTIVPVHDLRCRFGGPQTDATENHVVVIVWIGTKTVGVLVDAVSDIITVPENDIRPVPETQSSGAAGVISGLVSIQEAMIALIDLNTLFPVIESEAI